MSILLTGGTGFVGEHFCRVNPDCTVVIREGTTVPTYVNNKVFQVGTIGPDTIWKDTLSGISTIVHLAGIAHKRNVKPEIFNLINADSTINLAKQAAENGIKRFVFVSSIGVNGNASMVPFSYMDREQPHDAYSHSKYNAEFGLKKLGDETGLEVVIVRPTLVYGPKAPGNFGLLTKLVKKLPVLPFGQANNKRDFIAVQNLADLLIVCATHPNAAGHTFLASDMETVSIKQFTNAIAEGLGKKVLQLPIPVSLMRLAGKLMGKSTMVEQLVGNLQVDSSNIKEILNWTPPLTMKQAMATLRDSDKSSSGKE
ncbi:NAD-dependent epimerase/dehydratase family protein [Morganella morganii]|nr:NAD-dependent epimerase/dehydratase family protein [Morganella morganii]